VGLTSPLLAAALWFATFSVPGNFAGQGGIMFSFRHAARTRRSAIFAAIAAAALLVTSGIAVAQENKKTPIPAGKARLVFNRVGTVLFVASAAIVRVNGQEVASVWANNSAVVDIAPGNTAVSVSAWAAPGDFVVNLKAKPGATYNFEISPRIERVNLFGIVGAVGQYIDANTKKNTGHFSIRLVK
jgi:hypothetical protein